MVFEAFKEERDWRAIGESLGINPRNAHHWLRKSQETPGPRGGSLTRKKPCFEYDIGGEDRGGTVSYSAAIEGGNLHQAEY